MRLKLQLRPDAALITMSAIVCVKNRDVGLVDLKEGGGGGGGEVELGD